MCSACRVTVPNCGGCNGAVRSSELRCVEQVVTLGTELGIITRSRMLNGNFFTRTTSTLRVKSVRMSGEPRADIAESEGCRRTENGGIEPARNRRIVDCATLPGVDGRCADRDRLSALDAHDSAEVPAAENCVTRAAEIHPRPFPTGSW